MDSFGVNIQKVIEDRYQILEGLWEELGIDQEGRENRSGTVLKHITVLMDKMVNEEKKAKEKVLNSLEHHTKQALKLSKELEVEYVYPESTLVLVQYERAVRHEAQRLGELKAQRMEEAAQLRKTDEELCARIGMDPFYLSSNVAPTTAKLEELKKHISTQEQTLASRKSEVEQVRDNIIKLYAELETEPSTEMEREFVCENLDRFLLSTKNIELVNRIYVNLEDQLKANQKLVMECIEKIDSLYERLTLDANTKFQFLAENQGHSTTVINSLKTEIARLEEIKQANIEKFVINIRNELYELWNKCYYSEEQRNAFLPLHSTNFNDALLDAHEAEVQRLKEHYKVHQDLFVKVEKRQEVWNKFKELESRAKDPSRLMNTRGNTLLLEEKERNKVNKALPRIEQELHELIEEWEGETGRVFLVHGVNFEEFIEKEKEEHLQQLDAEKIAREQAKKKTIMQETRFGAKPSTPARLKVSANSKSLSVKKTPGSSRVLSRINQGLAAIRSPRTRAAASATDTPVTKKDAALRKKNRGSYGIKRGERKDNKTAALNKSRLTRGVLSTMDNSTIVSAASNANFTIQSVDVNTFNRGNFLNSTKAEPDRSRAAKSYMTPTKSTENRMFKTPTTVTPRTSRTLSRLRTPVSSKKTLPRLI